MPCHMASSRAKHLYMLAKTSHINDAVTAAPYLATASKTNCIKKDMYTDIPESPPESPCPPLEKGSSEHLRRFLRDLDNLCFPRRLEITPKDSENTPKKSDVKDEVVRKLAFSPSPQQRGQSSELWSDNCAESASFANNHCRSEKHNNEKELLVEKVEETKGVNVLHLSDKVSQGDCEDNRTRKRIRKETPLKRNMAKAALDSGLEHLNTKGEISRARKMGLGCNAKSCRSKCHKKLTELERRQVFNQFWTLKNHTHQWEFINSLVVSSAVKGSNIEGRCASKRNIHRKYFFMVNGKSVQICRTMFLSTLDVSESWLKTAQKKLKSGHTILDMRGKNSKVKHV